MKRKTNRFGRRAGVVVAAAVAMLSSTVGAATKTWIGGQTGNWDFGDNWSGDTVPASGDNVNLSFTTAGNTTITYDYTGPDLTLNSLTLDQAGAPLQIHNATLVMSANNLLANSESIGDSGAGSNGQGTINQSGGANNAGTLTLGVNASDVGTYALSGSGLLTTGNIENIGLNGAGTFNQDGGSNSVSSGGISVGVNAGSQGTYNLNTGSVTEGGSAYVGFSGTGTFNQVDGTHHVGGDLTVGNFTGSQGSYSMTGIGTLTVIGHEMIGQNGSGAFTQSTGTNTAGGISIGTSTGSGTYTLSGSGQVQAVYVYVGDGGTGTVNESGGMIATATVSIGRQIGSTGAFNLSGAAVLNSNVVTVGDAGTGTLTQTAGLNSTEVLSMGSQSGSNGTYTLSQNGAMSVDFGEHVGQSGTGTFNHSAGTNTVLGSLYIGENSGAVGTYNLSGTGQIATGTAGSHTLDEYVGYDGSGTFNHSAGTNSIFGTMYVGKNAGSVGVYNLSGTGTLKYATIGSSSELLEYVGYDGSATFNQTGGTNNPTFLQIGAGSGTGAYNLNGGDLRVEGTEQLGGSGGSGTFVQTGGTNTLVFNDSPFVISGSASSYTLHAGSFVSNDNEEIGGTFIQTGGTNNTESTIRVTGSYAQSGGSIGGDSRIDVDGGAFVQNAGTTNVIRLGVENDGIYTFSGGSLNCSELEYMGANETHGTFNQTGGSNRTAGLSVGDPLALDTGTYNLSGGLLSVGGDEDVCVNQGSSFNQTGGTNVVGGNLIIAGSGSGGTGSFTITNGITSVAGGVVVNAGGPDGSAQLTVGVGGSLIVTGSLTIANGQQYNEANVLNLSDGGLVKTSALDIGGNPAGLNWTGGTLDIVGQFVLDAGTFGQSLTLGGTQKLIVENGETVGSGGLFTLTINTGGEDDAYGQFQLNANTTLNLNGGGKFYAGFFVQAGGTVNGDYDNKQTYEYQSGIFNGRMTNEGMLGIANNMTLANGLEQDGVDHSLSVFAGQTLTCNGQGLDNLGTIELEGGTLAGSGPAINDYGGTLNAYGTISSAFTNLGLLNAEGTLRFTGGAINNGVINGNGTIIGSITNGAGGIIQPTSFSEIEGEGQVVVIKNPMAFTAFGGNNAGGTILIGAGLQLSMSNAWQNDGLVTLQGTAALLNGNTITNTGTIQGAGTVGAKIVNTTGTIRASGGELDLAGVGNTNAAGAQIQSATGSTLMVVAGLASNAGTIALAGGTFDNNSKVMSNTGSIEGNGIVRTGGLTNASGGVILLSDGASSIYGAVTNASGGNIKIVSNTTTFYGPVTNNGTIKVTSGVARFLGNGVSMTVGGTYNSDPSDNYFDGLAVTSTGTVLGGNGDRFFMSDGTAMTNAGTWNVTGTLSSNAVSNTGTFIQTGTLNGAGNFTNSGTVTIGGVQNWAAGTTFSNTGGTAAFQSDAGSNVATPLAINASGGAVTLGSTQHLASVSLSGGANAFATPGGNKVVRANAVSIGTGSKFDLADNKLVTKSAIGSWNGSAYSGVLGMAASGRLMTSQASASSGLTILAVAANSDLSKTSFGGESIGSSDVLVMYTYAGDANLTGNINGDDYFRIDSGFSLHATGYDNGDFNLDGRIDADDYFIIDRNYARQGTAFTASESLELEGVQMVPEPGCFGVVLVVVGAGALSRKRRRRVEL